MTAPEFQGQTLSERIDAAKLVAHEAGDLALANHVAIDDLGRLIEARLVGLDDVDTTTIDSMHNADAVLATSIDKLAGLMNDLAERIAALETANESLTLALFGSAEPGPKGKAK